MAKLHELQKVGGSGPKERARTAPARERRRNWNMESVDINTNQGQKKHLKAPTYLSGKYEDDFEEINSDDEEVGELIINYQ